MSSNVDFGDKFIIGSERQVSKMAGLVIKYSGGLIRDEKQANSALVVLAVLFMLISFYFWF